MTGIYKITNKINGKIYIGKSYYCEDFLEDDGFHDNEIRELIKEIGKDYVQYEILKTVPQDELDFWQDYFIVRYHSMAPKGYNTEWNYSEDLRAVLFNSLNDCFLNEITITRQQYDILDIAAEDQLNIFSYNKERISNERQLKRFLKEGLDEAARRKPLIKEEIVLPHGHLTPTQEVLYDRFSKMIDEYNSGVSLYDIEGYNPEKYQEYSYYTHEGKHEFSRQAIREARARCGYPTYSKESKLFLENGIIYFPRFCTLPDFKPLKFLFDEGYLNPEKFSLFTRRDGIVDYTHFKTKEQLRRMYMIYIGDEPKNLKLTKYNIRDLIRAENY